MTGAVYVAKIGEQQLRTLRRLSALFLLVVVATPVLLLTLKGPQALDKWTVWRYLEYGAMAVIALALPFVAQRAARARLTVDESGVTYDARLPPWLAWLAPRGWFAPWDRITKCSLLRLQGGVLTFVIRGRAFTTSLPLQGWVPEHLAAAGAEPAWYGNLQDSPIWQAFAARGLIDAGGHTLIDFDLARHPSTRAGLIACAVLGISGILVTVFEGETYIADGYGFLAPHGLAGLLGMALFWKGLAAAREPVRLPRGVPAGMAVFGGLASAMFSYGALAQLNKLAAPAVPTTYAVGSPCTTLEPADPAMPRIIWSPGFSDYWCEYRQGSQLSIPVRKGLFGTWQFDQGAFVEKIREYREARRRK